jgi:hypothetical protein
MNGNATKGLYWWALGALAAAGAAYWWYQQSQSGDASANADGSGDSPDSGASGAAAADQSGAPQGLGATLLGWLNTAGQAVGITQAKGIRNNNPGNLRYVAAIQWKGITGQDATGYATFDTAEDGVRAMGHNLRSYIARGLLTVTQIISTWAPSSENDTAAYIADVAGRLGVDPDQPLNVGYIGALAVAITYHENGSNPYGDDAVAAWAVEP